MPASRNKSEKMDKKPLKLGVAYLGNRMPSHARQDFIEIAKNGMNLVVHMLSLSG